MTDSELATQRLKWAGPLTVVASALAVALLRLGAIALVHPSPRFFPIISPLGVFDAVVLSSAAVFVFARFCRDNARPVDDYRRLAFRILLVSFVPVALVWARHAFGGGWREAVVLLAMHTAVWSICVTLPPIAVRATSNADAYASRSGR